MLAQGESGYNFADIKTEFGAAIKAFSREEDLLDIDTVSFFDESGLSRTSFLRDPLYSHIDTNRFLVAIKALEDGEPGPFVELAVELLHIGIEVEFNNGNGNEDYKAGEQVDELIVCHRGELKNILGNFV